MTKKQEAFLDFVKSECKKHGVRCDLRKVSYLRLSGNIKCSGYFDDDDNNYPKLVVAANKKDWLEILVHEYCHMTQWLDQKSGKFKNWDPALRSILVVNDWLSGKKVRNIKYHMAKVRDLELDNEKRSVKMIKKWNLGIDLDMYIKKANAYILFYNHILTTRRWSKPKNNPYGNKRLIDAMSTSFRMSYKTNSKKVQKIFTEENI
jgi:hypothetical protein